MEDIIRKEKQRLIVPEKPIIPFIMGDGIGIDIGKEAYKVFNASILISSKVSVSKFLLNDSSNCLE